MVTFLLGVKVSALPFLVACVISTHFHLGFISEPSIPLLGEGGVSLIKTRSYNLQPHLSLPRWGLSVFPQVTCLLSVTPGLLAQGQKVINVNPCIRY